MDEWPLAGRNRELAAAVAALRRGDGVVIAGAPGSGRTRLALDLLARAAQAGSTTVRISATASAQTAPLASLAPLLGPGVGVGPDVFGAAAEAIARRYGGSRVMVLIDDAHRLDPASAALVLQLVVNGGISVVATVVAGARVPDAVLALWKDGHAERVDLALLDDDAVGELVDQALPGGTEGPTRRLLVQTAGGSPMALQQVLADGLASGALREVEGLWRAHGPLVAAGRTADLVSHSLEEVAPTGRGVLELLALGGPLGVTVLEGLAPASDLEELEGAGLLAVRPDGARVEAHLAAGPWGEVLRAQLPALRQRRLMAALADAVEGHGARRAGDLRQVVTWRLDSGARVEPERLLDAARDAHRALDFDLALRLARAAWTSTGTVDAGHILGHLLWMAGKHADADAVLSEVLELAADDDAIVHVTNTLTSNRLRGLHDPAGAEAAFERSLARLTDDRCRAALDAHQASREFLQGRSADALARAEPHLRGDEPWPFVEAAVAAAPRWRSAGGPGRRRHSPSGPSRCTRPLPRRPFAADDAGIHWITLAMAMLHGGRLEEGEHLATAGYEASLAASSVVGRAWFALLLGSHAQLVGRVRTASRWFSESAGAFERLGDSGLRRVALAGLAQAAAIVGDRRRALDAWEDIETCGSIGVRLYETMVAQARAWIAVGEGDRPTARSLLTGAAGDDLDTGRVTMAVHAAHDLARMGEAGPADELATAAGAQGVDGDLLPACLAHVSAIVSCDPDALEGVAALRADGRGPLRRRGHRPGRVGAGAAGGRTPGGGPRPQGPRAGRPV